MTPFLIIQSDSDAGRGVRGRSLYWFLAAYFGRRRVKIISSDQLLRSGGITADTVFVGCPSNIGAVHLANLRYRRLVLFDLTDRDSLQLEGSDRQLLTSLTDHYQKAWVDHRWDFGMTMGMAPVRRQAKMPLLLRADSLRRWPSRVHRPEKNYDVAFLGKPTRPFVQEDGELVPYYQRVEWLLEVEQAEPKLTRWGGLLPTKRHQQPIQERYGDISHISCEQKASFPRYFRALEESKVALCASGRAPWTYRHYEAIYAGAVVVTTDMRFIDTLVPLPNEGMIHVADHEPVVPAIRKAMELGEQLPEILDDNIAFLERYLSKGAYSRRRPELLDRFMAQLPTSGAEGVVFERKDALAVA